MRKFHTFELALLLALAAALLWGAWSLHRQDDLQAKMIRLHVIANSVRDAVLTRAEAILRESADMNDARRRLTDALPAIGDAAAAELAAQHRDDPISVSLEEAEFPLKAYDGFALPSGGYLALRVVIGAGEGRNWWCVVYPPLCTAAASDLSRTALGAGLTEDDLSLITGDGDGYVLRFRSLELWERLRQWLGK
ncbi:MAG: hypothetical protein BHW35_05335 [Firmicutes bacterium CAG:176_63_11]|nr:MAG: hypothetical protein BHW35_05335 [Firmicutes bacterium CAG:176_63_11]